MIAVHLTRAFQVHGCDDLNTHLDDVMTALLALESDTVRDADVSGSITESTVEISVYAIGEDFDAAAEAADSAIRSAIHAAEGHTPNWETIQSHAAAAQLVDAVHA